MGAAHTALNFKSSDEMKYNEVQVGSLRNSLHQDARGGGKEAGGGGGAADSLLCGKKQTNTSVALWM